MGKVLIVEDNPDQRHLIQKAFHRYDSSLELVLLESAEEGISALQEDAVDLVFIDHVLSGMSGIECIREMNSRNIHVPVILMTGMGDEKTAKEAIDAGAFDYVVKDVGYHNALPHIYKMELLRYKHESETHLLTESVLSIYSAIAEMGSSLDIHQIVENFLNISINLMEADAGTVYDIHDGKIVPRLSKNISHNLITECCAMRSAETSICITQGTDIPDTMRHAGVKSIFSMPLDIGDWRTTCISLFFFHERTFTDHNINEMELLSSAVKSALKNSMLFEMVTKSQKLWRDTFDAIRDFVFVTDEQDIIVKTNQAFADFVDAHPREIIGMKYSVIFPDESRRDGDPDNLATKLHGHGTTEVSLDGETYLISGFPITLENGSTATVHVMKNITELQKLKSQLYHTDKLSSIGLLVSGVAHEINNPLTGILGYTELLQMKEESKSLHTELNKIYSSAERCKTIVENLLTFARQRPPERSLENINDILEKTIQLRVYWLRSNNVEVEKHYSEIPYTLLDPQQVQQVILNLLINAEHAISQVANERKGRLTLSTFYNKERNIAVIEIKDNGAGIDEGIMKNIFDPFFTTKPVDKGTGLGLSISHGIIKEHGGDIEVESKKDKYTISRITLPIISKTV